MNFEEWVKLNQDETYTSDFVDPLERFGRLGWEACRLEVLKILKQKENFIGSGIKSAIKEIEKL